MASLVAAKKITKEESKKELDKAEEVRAKELDKAEEEADHEMDKALADAEKRGVKYRFLPITEDEQRVAQQLYEKFKPDIEKSATRKWGVLGLMGVNKSLEKVDDWFRSPFAPYGLSGIIFGASLVFFAYIGFDSISTHSEEAIKPQRDVPIGILASLVICTVLYIAVAAVLTGMVPYQDINPKAAVSSAFTIKADEQGGSGLLSASAILISTGALAGLTSVLLITFLSQARIFLAMARDRLLPPSIFGAIHPRFRTPHISTMLTGGIISIVAAVTPISKLEEMVNIGTLMAFVIVCAAVLLLRIDKPEANRPFRTPFLWVVAPLGILVNLIMMLFLPLDTWIRLVVWLAVGLVIYFGYGMRNSTVGRHLKPAVKPMAAGGPPADGTCACSGRSPPAQGSGTATVRGVQSVGGGARAGRSANHLGRREGRVPGAEVLRSPGRHVRGFGVPQPRPPQRPTTSPTMAQLRSQPHSFHVSRLLTVPRSQTSGNTDDVKMGKAGKCPPVMEHIFLTPALLEATAMRITQITCHLLHVPLSRPRALPTEAAGGRLNHTATLLVELDTDAGLRGMGFAYAFQSSGRALHAIAVDDITPLIAGEDPMDHERLDAKVYWRLQTVGRRGLVQQAYSAFDVALWDLKAKAANLPLYKLLGGAREASAVYGSDTAWLWMSPAEIIEASQPYLDQGMMGIKVKVGKDATADYGRLTRLRDAWGDNVWLAVDANERYDFETALAMGHFFEEEIGAAWFEEPITCEDVDGHVRLRESLDVPLAAGEMLFGRDEFRSYLEKHALAVLQPDVTRVGGITGFLRIAALADLHHIPISPHLLPEISVHLACGLPGVTSVEYMPWHTSLFVDPPRIDKGKLRPPPRPGLGLDVNPEAVAKYRVI